MSDHPGRQDAPDGRLKQRLQGRRRRREPHRHRLRPAPRPPGGIRRASRGAALLRQRRQVLRECVNLEAGLAEPLDAPPPRTRSSLWLATPSLVSCPPPRSSFLRQPLRPSRHGWRFVGHRLREDASRLLSVPVVAWKSGRVEEVLPREPTLRSVRLGQRDVHGADQLVRFGIAPLGKHRLFAQRQLLRPIGDNYFSPSGVVVAGAS